MLLEFRTKNSYYGNAHYLCIDTDAKVVTTTSKSWIAKDVPVVAKHDIDTFKQKAIDDGYVELTRCPY